MLARTPFSPATITSAASLPITQRMKLLMMRGDNLSLRCLHKLRAMCAPEPTEQDRIELQALNYVAFGKLTPSGRHAAGEVARAVMLMFERVERGEFVLAFERGLVAGLPPVLAAALLRVNGGVLADAAAGMIERHVADDDRVPAPECLAWLAEADLISDDRMNLTPRGRERVQAAWQSYTSGWLG